MTAQDVYPLHEKGAAPMLRMTAAAIVVAMFVAGVLVTGCAKVQEAKETAQAVGEAARFSRDIQDGKATFKGEDGQNVTVETQGKDENMTMTVKNEKGEEFTVAGGKEMDLKGLDIEVYPGARQEGGSRMSDEKLTHISAVFKTSDSFEKVAEFYKKKYPDAQTNEMNMGEQQMLIMTVGEEPKVKSISVTTEEGTKDLNIILSHAIDKEKPAE